MYPPAAAVAADDVAVVVAGAAAAADVAGKCWAQISMAVASAGAVAAQ